MEGDDFRAWEPDEPPRGFAERVVGRAAAETAAGAPFEPASPRASSPRRRVRGVVVAAAVVLGAAAAVALTVRGEKGRGENGRGDVTAETRREVALGDRAIAVLEPGARVAWDGDRVTQARGDVFYRVAPGKEFRVETPAGDAKVLGTCFRVKVREESSPMNARDVKVGLSGAALGAAVLVGVYEGRVALAQPKTGASVDLTAGKAGIADARGARAAGSLADGERALANGEAGEEEPLLAANASLADSVRTYKSRIESIEAEKKRLEKELAEAQTKLASAEGGALATGPKKSEFDLTDDDWKQLAKEGGVKVRYPCATRPGGDPPDPSPKSLNKLGLRPEDGKTIGAAFAASNKRRWAVVRPLCAQALAGAGDVADKVGEGACIAIIQTMAAQKDPAAADEGIRMAAEARAGLRPMPGPDDVVNPVERLMLALTGESKAIESDLAKSFGPEEANRIVYSKDVDGCWNNGSWGVGPRKAE